MSTRVCRSSGGRKKRTHRCRLFGTRSAAGCRAGRHGATLRLECLERRDLLAADGWLDDGYSLLHERIRENENLFYVFRDADAGGNHGFPSNIFAGDASGARADLIAQTTIDLACVDDPVAADGCSDDPTALDRVRGTVAQFVFPPLTGVDAYAGVGFEEPEQYGENPVGRGYDLRDTTHVLVDARTARVEGMNVQFSIGGSNTDRLNTLQLTHEWNTFAIDLSTLRHPDFNFVSPPDLTDVHALFAVVVSSGFAASGGPVMIDNVRFARLVNGQELPPANPTRLPAGESRLSYPVGNETFGVVPAALHVSDDGDGSFEVSGSWTHTLPHLLSHQDDQHTSSSSGNGTATATWTFEGLEPRVYEVQATWAADGANTTAGQYRLLDAGVFRSDVVLDQTVPPVGIEFDTQPGDERRVWQSLGVARVESGTLVVELTNANANGQLVADAVRLAPTIPPDQAIRNLTTTYESALTVFALLDRGEPADLAAARLIADTLLYSIQNDSTTRGGQLPTAPDGSRGLRDSYSSGDLALFNDAGPGTQGESRLPGFSSGARLCGAAKFCLVLDGAFGGNNAFGIMALMAAYREFGNQEYLDGAIEVGNWIYGNLVDLDGPAFDPAPEDESFGGYFLGYPDQGVPKDRVAEPTARQVDRKQRRYLQRLHDDRDRRTRARRCN